MRVLNTDAIATPLGLGDGSGAACPCGNTGGPGAGCANSTGSGARLYAFGSTSVARDDLYFTATGAPPSAPSSLFAGATTLNAGLGIPMFAGLRCAGAPLVRFGVSNALADGSWFRAPGLAALGAWSGGQTRVFQLWYRDPSFGCSATSSFSNGMSVTFVP